MKKNIKHSKILIIPDNKNKTFEIKITKKIRNILISSSIIILLFVSFVSYKYNFYKNKVSALISDESMSISSINQMSTDEVNTRKEFMKLKAEIDALNKFLNEANSINREIRNNLKIKYSNITFADIFKNKSALYERSHPASASNSSTNTTDVTDDKTLLKNSIENQKSYKKLMESTPSGYPAEGIVINSKKYFKGVGVAINLPYGSLIKATAIGKVKVVRKISKNVFVVEIEHNTDKGKSILTRYLFCQKLLVSVGKEVKKGQVIAYSTFYPGSYDSIFGYQVIVDNMLIQP
jgi:murein DD-endopeptidase MepM/ murein hydrolase activator NlpD